MTKILITGITGFLGEVLISDILKHTDYIIYGLIRSKKGKNIIERLEKLWTGIPLQIVKSEKNRLIAIEGDVSVDSWGISEEDISIIKDCDVIIHNASVIKFDEILKDTILHNVNPIIYLQNLMKRLDNVQRVIYTSTAYVSKPDLNPIFPKLEPMIYDYKKLTQDILEERVKWEEVKMYHNNTYTFSKSLAEHHFLNKIKNGIIVRPSIIGPALKYPIKNWNNSISGIVGYYLGFYKGISKFIFQDKISSTNIVPVDIVTSKIISIIEKKIEKKNIFYAINNNTLNAEQQRKILINFSKYYSISNLPIHFTYVNKYTYIFVYIWQFILRCINIKYYKINKMIHSNYDFFSSNYWNFYIDNNQTWNTNKKYIKDICKSSCKCVNNGFDHYTIIGRKYENPEFDIFWAFGTLWFILIMTYFWGFYGLLFALLLKHAFTNTDKNEYSITYKITGYVLRKIFRRIFNRIIVNIEKLEDELQSYDGPIVFVANHRSYFDWLIIPYLFFDRNYLGIHNLNIIAAKQFESIPLIGRLMKWLGALFISRNGEDNKNVYLEIERNIRRSQPILFFPEGTRSRDRQFKIPKLGVLKIIKKCKCPVKIIPLTLTYQSRPDDILLYNELDGIKNPFMNWKKLGNWLWKCFTNRLNYGNIYVNCSKGIIVNDKISLEQLGHDIIHKMQKDIVIWEENFTQKQLEFFRQKNVRILKTHRKEECVFYKLQQNNWIHFFYQELLEKNMINGDNIVIDYSIPKIDISKEELNDLLHKHKQKVL